MKSPSEKKELKHLRTKRIFAETARDMILEDGVASVSVRKAADRAGYSLGTVYNHFSSLDEMLWMTRELMIEELGTNIGGAQPETLDDIRQGFHDYMDYFIQNPNIFRFFFFHHLDSAQKPADSKQKPEDSDIMTSLTIIMTALNTSMEDAGNIYGTMIFTIQGMLTMLISDNDGNTAEELHQQLDHTMDLLFSRRPLYDSNNPIRTD